MQSSEPSREAILRELNVKSWSVRRMCTGLDIDQKLYREIYAALDTEVRRCGAIRDKINNITTKQSLQPAFDIVYKQFPEVFEGVDCAWREECLTHWAQKCNNNRKRRKTTREEPLVVVASGEQAKRQRSALSPPVFSNITVCVRRKGHNTMTMCRPQDLVLASNRGPTNIEIDDVQFDRFISVLVEDIQFDKATERILYKPGGGKALEITNERSWRGALLEMYSSGQARLTFNVCSVRRSPEDSADSSYKPDNGRKQIQERKSRQDGTEKEAVATRQTLAKKRRNPYNTTIAHRDESQGAIGGQHLRKRKRH